MSLITFNGILHQPYDKVKTSNPRKARLSSKIRRRSSRRSCPRNIEPARKTWLTKSKDHASPYCVQVSQVFEIDNE